MENMTKLGNQLDNPFSVKNMSLAWENLKKENSKLRMGNSEDVIKTTHLYLKFIPKNEEQLSILARDTSLVLYTYPLDYEIVKEGNFYHDPSVPVSQPTYQYCAIEKDQQIPEQIEYEVLEELFIPDEAENNENVRLNSIFNEEITQQLIDEAYRITGNEDFSSENSKVAASKWRPSGRIRVWDDVRGNWSGVVGVEVRARRWFTTYKGQTNSTGSFTCNGTFRRDANYSLKWEQYHYSIRSGSFGQAKLDGPKRRGSWFRDIGNNELQKLYAFIHLASYNYYYGNRLWLKRPPLNGIFKPQMKIGGHDEDGRSNHNKNRRCLGFSDRIRIFRNINGSRRNSEEIYNVTLHELAHASHWELRKGNWSSTEGKLKESWALGAAWALTRLRYPNHDQWENVSFEWMRNEGEGNYTPLIIDLIDNVNQGATNTARPFDRVTGYSIREIEAVLSRCKNIAQLQNELDARYNKNSDEFLDELFEQYINLER
ncbi:hypothetical protein [Persicobacter sp. CCB-QB2]|uniref:hypothetical protein n=1 Tax=Persicobacter sp. CCB-QB2 TaxID=1561025 RepID=UPI0006A9953B|nr:hypothetical protein [Persicobacter sp. CCB-QB2]